MSRRGCDAQRAGDIADRVVGIGGTAGGDGVRADGLLAVAVVENVGWVVSEAEVSPLTKPE